MAIKPGSAVTSSVHVSGAFAMLPRKNYHCRFLAMILIGACVAILSMSVLFTIQYSNQSCDCGNDAYVGNATALGVPKIDGFTAIGSDQDHISVSISLNVSAKFTVASVVLYYRVSGMLLWKASEMNLTSTRYVTTVGYFAARDIMQYYVRATNRAGQATCSPANASLGYYSLEIPYHPVVPVIA